jgi:hypothetical protein
MTRLQIYAAGRKQKRPLGRFPAGLFFVCIRYDPSRNFDR